MMKIQTSANSIVSKTQNYRNIAYLIKRTVVSPIRLVAGARGSLDLLISTPGRRISAYHSDTHERLAISSLNQMLIELAVYPIDPSVIAIASLHHALVYSITTAGFCEFDCLSAKFPAGARNCLQRLH
jgi:hypothetical protein